MRSKAILVILSLAILAATADAREWKNKIGLGVRGVGVAPLFDGSDFYKFDDAYEPFEMGWYGAVEARYGLTKNIVLNFSAGVVKTYDDSTATGDQSFSWKDVDNASAHLRGRIYSLTGSYYFRTEERFQPFVTLGLGIDHWRLRERRGYSTYDVTDMNAKLGAGLSYWLFDFLTVDFKAVLSYGIANLDSEVPEGVYGPGDWTEWSSRPFRGYLEPSAGVTFYLGGNPDADKDGVSDKKDRCPGTPQGAVVDDDGCPLDTDGDGVFDGLDRCPNSPAGVKVDAYGCGLDSDGDGVFDTFDDCPNTPEGVAVNDRGCAGDADGDGVPDYKDKCPDTPARVKVDADGCPLDSDKDGVFDGLDKCPGTPADTEVDATGCPKIKKIIGKITLRDNVKYASGSYEISEGSRQTLDSLARSMKAYPETEIVISGYCDSTGPAAFNQTLSENRAKAVADYMRGQGVEGSRMTTRGFGEDPKYFIASNSTADGRQKNRRVEIESKK